MTRYKSGDARNNAILRAALLHAWGDRCYLCKQPKDFADMHIDHIVPQHLERSVTEALVRKHLPPARAKAFHRHGVENLAPICSSCNATKAGKDFSETPGLMLLLDTAERHKPEVTKNVRAFSTSNAVARAMLSISTADLVDPASKKALLDLAPLVVARLRTVAPGVLTEPENHDFNDPQASEFDQVLVTIDEASRRARVILEDVYGGDLDAALHLAVADIKQAITDRLEANMVKQLKGDGHYEPDLGGAEGQTEIVIEQFRFDASDGYFELRGGFGAVGSSDAAVSSGYATSGTEWLQCDANVEGTFVVSLYPEDSPAGVFVDDVDLTVS